MHDTANCAALAALALLAVVTANTVSAQGTARASAGGYPTKPVRMIVPLAPGGGSDIVGRIIALELFNQWGQAVVVDNRPGAGSTVGTSIVARAPADGYTVLVSSSSIALPHVRSGRIKALGVSSLKRSPLAPDLPTVAEAGVPGFEYTTWYGMFVPAATPRFIVNRLQADVANIIKTPQLRERFAAQGLDLYGTSPAEFGTYLNTEIAKWDKVVRMAGVRAD